MTDANVVQINEANKPLAINRDALREYIRELSPTTAVYVGCDSKRFRRRGKPKVAYVTVVIVHFDSSRGAKVFREVEIQDDFSSRRQRLLTEVWKATEMAMEIVDDVGDRPFEVHLDINPNPAHGSSIVVKEATGMVLGQLGFKPKLKPESMASSTAADRYTQPYGQRRRHRRGK